MAVKIRLTRLGKKKAPTYRVIVADERARRDGDRAPERPLQHEGEEPRSEREERDGDVRREMRKRNERYREKRESPGGRHRPYREKLPYHEIAFADWR